jgi:hypothetical protein
MEPEGSLPYSQVPATCPYPEPARSSQCPLPTSDLLKIQNKLPVFLKFLVSLQEINLCDVNFSYTLMDVWFIADVGKTAPIVTVGVTCITA